MKLLLVLPALALAASSSAVELVANGNFEATPPETSWTEVSAGDANIIDDWSMVTDGAVLTNSAFLGGTNNAADQISQTLTAPVDTAGGTLAFDLTRFNEDLAGFDFLTVSIDGTVLESIDLGDSLPEDYYFSRRTYTLPASFGMGTHTLLFSVTTDNAEPSAAFVDNITLDANVNPVPEPATLAVLGLGVALLRRRNRTKSA